MSEETRIVEENVEQETTAEADVSQPEAAPEVEPTAELNKAPTADAAEAVEVESAETESAETESAEAESAEAESAESAEPVVAESSEEPAADVETVTAEADAEAPAAETPTAEASTAEASTAETPTAEASVSDATINEEGAVAASDTETSDVETESATGEGGDTEDQGAEDDSSENEGDEDDSNVIYLSVGQQVEGVVKRTTDFGAFVDIGAGRDGLIHISELAVGRVNKVTDVVKEGQQVTCWIKKLDRKRNRISLTLISPDTKTVKDLQEGEVVPGKVSKIMPYGAFVDIGVGTDGLLHIREMSTGYVNKPEDVVKTGEEIEVRIIGVDRRRRRIDLSLKGLRDEPEAEQPVEVVAQSQEDDAVADPYANVEVLSPMELAFKRAMEAEGVEVNVEKAARKVKQRRKKSRAIQEEIINRTLDTMRE